jgi:hypothetical protein
LTGKFFCNNYKQALDILARGPILEKAMEGLGVTNVSALEGWLEEERVYLKGLSTEPIIETWQMEYYEKLVKLTKSE